MCDPDVYMTVCREKPCNSITLRYATQTQGGKYVRGGKDVNLDIYIMVYRDTAMKIINTDRTVTMIIMVTI